MNKQNQKDMWAFIAWGLLAYTFLVYAPDREKAGYYRGLCEAGQGLTDEVAEHCRDIHP